MALGALAGIAILLQKAKDYNLPRDLRREQWRKLDQDQIEKISKWLWSGKSCRHNDQIVKSLIKAKKYLIELTSN
jgi:hypothetical protein